MDDYLFCSSVTAELAALPAVVAVALGGSRAQGTQRPESDWDFSIYYRGQFDPANLRAKGWEGQVTEIGGWGGGIMNGGAHLTIDGRRVDVHYRDRTDVGYWCSEAEAGRFKKELLLFYVAGIPTYVLMAELALNRVLSGNLPRPDYPEALSASASERWNADSKASFGYAEAALRSRGDAAVGLANATRGLIELAHARLAARKEWVLNEKGMVKKAGLGEEAASLLATTDVSELSRLLGSFVSL